MVKTKRAYEPAAPSDGFRVLVDRLWPRGLTKDAARIDHWAKDAAPSTELRKWFGHDPARFAAFSLRYRHELARPPARAALEAIVHRAVRGDVTLVYGARDEEHNGAVVLKDQIESAVAGQPAQR